MKQTKVNNVKIKGIVCAVPKEIMNKEKFEKHFSPKDIEKTTKMTGVRTIHIADKDTCTSDLCSLSARDLMMDIKWEPETIDALIFVSQTPDYRIPATSCIVQERLGLSTECIAFDVNLGCSGYVYGLWMASNLISSGAVKRVLLLVGDTASKLNSPDDRSTVMLFGDAGTATALEYDESAFEIDFVLGTDGKGKEHLIIPAGGFRTPVNKENLIRTALPEGGTRGENDLFMDGGEIFNFTIKRVPAILAELLTRNNLENKDIDYFVFHQANEFIIKHLAKKAQLTPQQTPISIDKYGNTSSASIPLTIVSELAGALKSNEKKIMMVGFGVGYSWGGTLINMGPLSCLKLLEV